MIFKPFQVDDKNKLFQDYLQNFEKVKSFYPHYYQGEWPAIFKERSAMDYPREDLYRILMDQNLHWNAPFPVLENIKKLREPNTFAVVTGQQAGVFGGPLYTVYKSMTVLKLTNFLQTQYPQFQFVPVFWMEIDDNDFQEINSIQYIDKDNQLRKLQLEEAPAEVLQPIFSRKIPANLQEWKEKLHSDFFDTEFKAEVLETFFEIYSAGQTFENAFARLLLKLLGRKGLIMFNPVIFPAKKLVKSLIRKTLLEAEEILRTVQSRNEEIEKAGYHSQIRLKQNQTLLFFLDDRTRRVRVDHENGQYSLNTPEGPQKIATEALLQMVDHETERFSPNVALRPLIQDSLLPTAAYVAGPAEIAYFAQLSGLYEYFKIPMPCICPRHRITIVERNIRRLIKKLELRYEEIFEKKGELIEFYLTCRSDDPVLVEMEKLRELLSRKIEDFEPLIRQFDPTLLNSLQQTGASIEKSLNKLQHKIVRSYETREKNLVRQLEKIIVHLMPNNNYQERELNILPYLIKYGWNYLDEIFDALPVDTTPHYIGEAE